MHIRSDEWLDDNARCIELIEHMLAGNVDVTEHSIQHDDILEVDRSKFNRCVDVPCYTLVGET